MLGDAQSDALWVEMPHEISTVPHCRDADDDMFIRGGLAASVRWLVAGDSDFLAVPAMDELKILTAHEALTADNCCSQS